MRLLAISTTILCQTTPLAAHMRSSLSLPPTDALARRVYPRPSYQMVLTPNPNLLQGIAPNPDVIPHATALMHLNLHGK